MARATFYKKQRRGQFSMSAQNHLTYITLNIRIHGRPATNKGQISLSFSARMQFQIFDFTRPSSREALFECLWYAARLRRRPFGKKNEACALSIASVQKGTAAIRTQLVRKRLEHGHEHDHQHARLHIHALCACASACPHIHHRTSSYLFVRRVRPVSWLWSCGMLPI